MSAFIEMNIMCSSLNIGHAKGNVPRPSFLSNRQIYDLKVKGFKDVILEKTTFGTYFCRHLEIFITI